MCFSRLFSSFFSGRTSGNPIQHLNHKSSVNLD
ncbi:Protein of unknown function [Pyronema omphalodes CBS 100304]|uniref:Uncharacterized protein n=1 Tax=Pyronema omphalodes (strain CBS 100304) TaxID=1076935 RepID=U4KXC9_PYROM|nr:Protein of unknown function [Pyronema omphalodes CBS 100304]